MLNRLLRSNVCNVTRDIRVIPSLKAPARPKDLKKSFIEAFRYILRITKMDIDRKMKELDELFSKTGKELNEILKKNEEFVTHELRRVLGSTEENAEVRSKERMDRLQDVRGAYEKRIKICNDKAASGLRAAKTKYDLEIRRMESLREAMRQILRECLETNEFVKCVAGKTKEAVKRRKEIVECLNDTVKNAELSTGQQLKEATMCHANAQVEAIKSLRQILKDTKDLVFENDKTLCNSF